jgi:hypothetical protein
VREGVSAEGGDGGGSEYEEAHWYWLVISDQRVANSEPASSKRVANSDQRAASGCFPLPS